MIQQYSTCYLQPGMSGYFLPLLTQNFYFPSAHYAKIAKLARTSLKQSQFFGSIRWGK